MTSIDISLLLVRLVMGGVLVAHGINKATGPRGFGGTAEWFKALGLEPAGVHARIAALSETGAGLMLALGLLTSVTATVVVTLMVVAAFTDHRDKGFFIFKGGWEYTLVVGVISIALAISGPGTASLDHWAGIDSSGVLWGLGVAAVGAGAAGLLMALCYRPAPGRHSSG
ncbi:DoxX family membrane protein [Rhodococcus hoagii]|nr:DoxX family membrane protein [Prescottella equi]